MSLEPEGSLMQDPVEDHPLESETDEAAEAGTVVVVAAFVELVVAATTTEEVVVVVVVPVEATFW